MRQSSAAVSAKQSIISAFVELIQEKEYASVSVTDIVKRAGVSRMAYYRSFGSKEEILVEYLDEILVNLLNKIRSRSEIDKKEIYRLIFHAIAERAYFFKSITDAGLTDVINSSIIRHSYILIKNYFRWRENDRQKIYAFYYHVGGLIIAARVWIENGMSESLEEMAEIVCGISDAADSELPLSR